MVQAKPVLQVAEVRIKFIIIDKGTIKMEHLKQSLSIPPTQGPRLRSDGLFINVVKQF